MVRYWVYSRKREMEKEDLEMMVLVILFFTFFANFNMILLAIMIILSTAWLFSQDFLEMHLVFVGSFVPLKSVGNPVLSNGKET